MSHEEEERRMMVTEALHEVSPELRELAERVGVNYRTLKAWKAGDRVPNAENMEKLAEVVGEQSDRLHVLARDLRTAAREKRQEREGAS